MQIAAGMTLEQKVAQMFMITPDALSGVTDTVGRRFHKGSLHAVSGRWSDLYGKEPDRNRPDRHRCLPI